ncbi:MAG: YIP1 family protein [Gemmatimonadetes bacterium]|nr:YIP1 family protein [Gemmatimonadota bacterium]
MASLTERMIGAAMLNVATYEEVEADQTATSQAAIVVAIVAVAGAIGNYFRHGGRGIIGAVIAAFLGWLLWAGITYFIGTRLFGGTATMGEMLRTLGFAQSPGVIAILGIIPFLGWLIMVVIAIWQLVAGIIAIRQALDFTTGKAILTALIGWVIVWIITAVLFASLLGGAMAGVR